MKCDERKPQCQHCIIGQRDCYYEDKDKSIRRGGEFGALNTFNFSADHVWLDIPAEVKFIHEASTNSETEGFETQSSMQTLPTRTHEIQLGEGAWDQPLSPNGDQQDSPSSLMLETPSLGGTRRNIPLELNQATSSSHSPPTSSSERSVNIDSSTNSIIAQRASGLSIYLQGPREPLRDVKAARLLQHYIDHLASWLDINDPQCHFATFVPHLAFRCPILLHAILAFSASHLSRLDGSCDELDAVKYHDECVKGLIQALENPVTAMDNVLPLSTVILRMYEMLSFERDHERHLRGCSSLFTHNRSNIEFRAMKRTAFWAYVREEILVALPNNKATNLHPSSWKADIHWESDEDYVRTNQVTWLTAEVVDFCFGNDTKVDQNNWYELQREIDLWKQNLPETFQPLYVVQDSKPFPEISYVCTWHVIGMQFYHLAKVLLALYSPHHANGLNFLRLARSIEDEVRSHTIGLCGMTKGLGSKHPGALVNGVQPLIICGRTLKDSNEQLELLSLLRQIEQTTAWSTLQGIECLQDAWRSQIL
ncbi:hypothetical protein L207DRAFT_505204 [Hyaloscypha variabilis F]|uniref:Zn(2)-C6 fungal-type domain-containing protein n=1 Tax=Hyaloscypha variabilis (strain UAMH 11265 / GT02V1 / F) TaxID=1149755 RepID=A0A2J6SBL4_HYAVF|nr:hypothetical protein L207DRAFT_505204 [Hyaloscypha variabilis F]